ncbi:FG-GAP-like repeat-containing protein, partial [Marichromatium gracile]
VDQTTLTFTPEDWDTPQQVTVTAVDDSVGEGPHRGVISHTVTSTDAGYDGAAIDNVQVAVTDDDLPTEEPTFQPPQVNPLGLDDVGAFASPTFADIDADGDLDVFVGTTTTMTVNNGGGDGNGVNGILFFENTGDASNPAFSSAITNPFGLSDVGNGASPSLVDLDGDGDLDLVVGNLGGDLLFFENTGTASSAAFGNAQTTAFGLEQNSQAYDFAFADLDGDGLVDAFVGNDSGELFYFHNTGSATQPDFAAPSASPFGLSPVDRSTTPTLADIDGDGRLDLLVGGYSGDIWLFENTGSTSEPAFASAVSNPYGLTNVGVYSSPALADLDADGDLDALVGNSDGDLLLFRNGTPPGVTLSQSSVEVTEGGATATYTLVLDTQPSADVTVTLDTTNDQVGVDQTTLTFTPEDWDTPQQVTVTAVDDSVGEGPHRGVISHTVTSTDSGYDGAAIDNVQIAVTDDDLPTEEPTFQPPQVNPLGLDDVGASASPTFADIDADGDLDVFVGNDSGDLLFFENTGGASNPDFSSASTNPFGLSNVDNYTAPSLADLDGDGDLDLVVGNWRGDLLFFENTGTASEAAFAPPTTNPFNLPSTGMLLATPVLTDLNDDGRIDAFVSYYNGKFMYFQNTGSPTQPDFVTFDSPSLPFMDLWVYPALADIDGDDLFELLVGNSDGDIFLFENIGSVTAPSFDFTVMNPYGLSDMGLQISPALADLDADGDLDALVGNSDGDLLLLLNGETSGGGGSGSTPDRDDEGDGDLFVGEDGAILDNGRIDTGLNPTESFTDTTLDGAPVTTGTTTDSRTGEDVAVVVSDPSAPGERTDVDPTTPEVDIPIGGLVVSKPESLGLIATSRVSTERSALETLTGGDDAAADPEEAAGRAALIDSLESRAAGGGVEVVQVTPVWPSEGGAGDAPLRLTIDLGDDSGSDARPTLVVVDTSALYDAAGAPLGPVEIVVAGAGTLVVRGPGSFRGDDGDTGADVDIVQGDGSAQVLFFGPDDDIIRGGGGDDTLGSAGGRDRLFGDGGDDRLDGGLGADILVGGSGNDQLAGGFGADTAEVAGSMTELTLTRAADGSATLVSASGTDTLGADVELLVSTADGAITLVQTFSSARHPGLGIDATFDAAFYLAANPDVAAAVASGTIADAETHFLTWGAAEGRAPNASWDENAYLTANPEVSAAVDNGEIASGIVHYLGNGARDLTLTADTAFDATFYLAENPDVAAAIAAGTMVSAESHFLGWGMAEGRAPHALWDAEDYLADNPDVAAAVADGTFASAVEHYWCYGADEDRAPGPWFDTGAYLADNPDVAAAGLDAASHFVLWGAAEGRLGTVADTELLLA